MTGYTAEEAIGKSPRILQGPRTDKDVLARLRKNLERGEVFAGEIISYRKDGTEIILEWQIAPIRNVGREITHFVATQHDITERKQVDAALREEQSMFCNLADTIPDMIYFKDRQSRFIRINRAVEQLFGLRSAAEAVGKTDYDFFGKEHARQAYEDEQQIMHSGEPLIGREEKETWPDGRVTWVSSTKVALRDTKGNITGLVGISRDITERKKQEEQFRQSQKMDAIGHLAGGVAHDFNNILAVIQLQTDLLKISGNLSPEQLELAEEISMASQRASALTRQLLLFSRKETLKRCDLDLNQSLNAMANMLRRILGEDIQMQFKFSMQPLFIHADAGMMDQVLMNLTVNSRDAMSKGGQLVIEISAVDFGESVIGQSAQARPGSFVCLSVSDTGCGIPPENLSKIFEPFFTTKDVGKGTGLGLATVFGIIQQHQGWVNVHSEVGQGTTFSIYLPRLAKMSPQTSEQPKPALLRGGGNETILLVEDDMSLHASVRKILLQLGYRVLDATNGIEALEVWNQNRGEINLLLTDLVMPGGINGMDLVERLLKDNSKLKVIYASGYSAEVAGKDCPLEEGVNFLIKPFQAQKLAQILRKRLDFPSP
jgi:PAS domain S-box-containing protein